MGLRHEHLFCPRNPSSWTLKQSAPIFEIQTKELFKSINTHQPFPN
jgi:hypothetical protein